LTAYCNSSIVPRAIQLVPRMNMDLIIGKIYPLNEIDKVFEDFKKSIYPKILVYCG
jgi:(R,R)-butanediol dehydrogenase/meso-butanediol dehydrogenase/diacetyl reductase